MEGGRLRCGRMVRPSEARKSVGRVGEDFGVGSLIGSVCHTNIFVAYFTESLGKSR